MMTTTTPPSRGNAFHHTHTASSGEQNGPSYLHPEWMPLDEIAQTWATLGADATSPAAFQTTGMAFCALAFEASALRHYASAVHRDGKEHTPSFAHVQGIERAITDLDEAHQQWQSVLLWLDALAREARQQGELPTSVGRFTSLVLEQQQRVLSLLLRVQQEYLNAHHDPLLISLRHLPATPEKGELP